MDGSLTAQRAKCVHCGKQFIASKESSTPSGKCCSALCYRQWVRMKVRDALGVSVRTEPPCGESNSAFVV
jgi:hypothetical protein